MEKQHEVFLKKTEPAEPGPSQTAVVWSVMVFLWCEVWSSGGSARACCDDFHSPSRNMFPETGHSCSVTVQSWLTMACVCLCVWAYNRTRITPLLSRLSPVILSTMDLHPLTTSHDTALTAFCFSTLCPSCLLSMPLFPFCVPHTTAQSPFRQCVHVKAFIVLEKAVLPASILLCKFLSPPNSDIYRHHKTCFL